MRIVSLIASATEIVHALDLGPFQVGRSHECDFPPAVLDLPICSRPAFAVSGDSRQIDQAVQSRLHSALSIYEVDSALLRQLAPTHIITQTQCKVCAVSLEDVERAFRADAGADAAVIALEPYALSDLWRDIRLVANACDCAARGDALVELLQAEMIRLHNLAHLASRPRRVAAIEWFEPLMSAGNWVPELLAMANAESIFGSPGEHSPYLEWDAVVEADPDVIIGMPCGFDLARSRAEAHWLSGRSGWESLSAVRHGEVFLCDGNQYLNRPGPRLADSLQLLAEILHPNLFPPTLEGSGWERLPRR